MSFQAWLPGPLDRAMERAVERIARTEGVVHVALMPDAHLADEVCVGTVVAARDRVFPDAVGGDIGCGMCAIGFDAEADAIDAHAARAILDALRERVPILKHRDAPPELPSELSLPSIPRLAEREGRWQLGTLGRGNHFVELQRDDQGALWAMIHSGSRGLGPILRDHHRSRGEPSNTGLVGLPADDERGRAYLADVAWARAWAAHSRARIERELCAILAEVIGAAPLDESRIEVDHNHVEREAHFDELLYVHRKGAMHAPEGRVGVIPGSMGSASYHVEGRGHPAALASCSHGAGRSLRRGEARKRIRVDRLLRETRGVFFDTRLAPALCEEAPSAYKDISAVMRAQRELVRIVRRLTPVLVYKGG
jgi:tRNA-splicing ligase RtcB